MRSQQAFDVLQVFGPPSNGLHDEQILYTRQAYAQVADVVNLAVADRRLLEQQSAKNNIDVDPGLYMSHQKHAASVREVERVLYAGKDSVTASIEYPIGPLSFRQDRQA